MNTLCSLLVCRDPDTRRLFTRLLTQLEIEVEPCEATEDAHQKLARRKFDAVLIACDPEQCHLEFFQKLRLGPYNRRALLLAVTAESSQVQHIRHAGVHFVIENSMPLSRVTATMRAARNLMDRERRRAFRRSVQRLVSFRRGDGQRFDAFILDLSQTGMAIRSTETLFERGCHVWLQFTLPGTEHAIETQATVMWTNDYGEAGFHFISLPTYSHNHIEEWLRERRRSIRRPVANILVECTVRNRKAFRASMVNISREGAAIRCAELLCPGTLLKMRILRPEPADAVEVQAMVTWVNPYGGAGVKFIDLRVASRQLPN